MASGANVIIGVGRLEPEKGGGGESSDEQPACGRSLMR